MNTRQKAFADHYLQTGKAAESARRAGYSARSSRTTGARLLANADIKQYIARRMQPEEERRIATADEVLQFLTDVMQGKVKDQFGLEPSLSDRLVAARELMKRLSVAGGEGNATLARLDSLLLTFRMAVSGENGGKVE